MEKILNQEEIDAMFRAARGGAKDAAGFPQVNKWDVRQAGHIRREQIRTLTVLHEGFAQNLTNSLGAYLRTGFQATLVSAEHLTYREFVQRIPELTYLASCRLSPMEISALLQLDIAVAFALLDLLLGGEGRGAPPPRKFTEIEEQILESIVRIICRELQSAWQALSLEFQFAQRETPENSQRLMSGEEKMLSLSFEIKVCESRGTLNLAVPAVVSNTLLRKISAEWARVKPRISLDSSERLRQHLLNCPFSVEVSLTHVPVPVRDLTDLTPGSLLLLGRSMSSPVNVLAQGHNLFTAMLARRGALRAGQVLAPVMTPKKGSQS